MATMNEKSALSVEVDFGETGDEARLDFLNRLARLYEQPGAKLVLKLEYGCSDDLIDGKAEISHALRHRDPGITVKYKAKIDDVDVIEADAAATPLERELDRLRPQPGSGVDSVTLSSSRGSATLRARTS